MENKFSKMMFALVTAVMLSVSSVYATWVNVQVTPGSWASEISWTLSDASGAIVASTNTGYYTASGVSVDYWVNVNDGCLLVTGSAVVACAQVWNSRWKRKENGDTSTV